MGNHQYVINTPNINHSTHLVHFAMFASIRKFELVFEFCQFEIFRR